MQFSTLFSIATSVALASAGVAQIRTNYADDVAVLNVYDDDAAETCSIHNPTVTIGVAYKVVGQCIPFSIPYRSVAVPGLADDHTVNFFIDDKCGDTIARTDVPTDVCIRAEESWAAYKVVNGTYEN